MGYPNRQLGVQGPFKDTTLRHEFGGIKDRWEGEGKGAIGDAGRAER